MTSTLALKKSVQVLHLHEKMIPITKQQQGARATFQVQNPREDSR